MGIDIDISDGDLDGIPIPTKKGLKIHPDFIVSEGGIFSNTYKLIDIKVQSVHIDHLLCNDVEDWPHCMFSLQGYISFPY